MFTISVYRPVAILFEYRHENADGNKGLFLFSLHSISHLLLSKSYVEATLSLLHIGEIFIWIEDLWLAHRYAQILICNLKIMALSAVFN